MNNWPYRPLSDFLIERDGRFKPNDPKIARYKRLDKIDFSGKIHISEKPSKTDMIIIEPGDLVISGINVAKGALAVYDGDEPLTATIHYSSYRFNENKIDIEFLKRFLKSPAFISELQDQVKGGIKTEIKPKHLLPLKARIPELAEQQKINHYFDAIDNEISDLSNEVNTQSSYLTKLRQAILQEAIEGKLTVDWRKENPVRKGDPDYDAEALLEKIQAEKEKLIKSKELKKGKLPKDSKSFRDLLEIPKQWVWVKADEVYFITKLAGFEYTKYIVLLENGDIPVIRAQNVRPLNIDKTNLLYIDEETSEKLSRCALTKECLLVTFIGAGIGDVATFMEKERWHLAPNVAKMEPFKNCDHFINNKYSNYFLLSNSGQREVFKHIKATAQPSLSMETIRDIDFPLPPLAEQQAIVDRVEKFLSMVDELEKQVSERKEQSEQLMQAVLREAFEGGK